MPSSPWTTWAGRRRRLRHRPRARRLVVELVAAGHADRILLSSNAIGVAKGRPGHDVPSATSSAFVPLSQLGVADDDIHRILVDNPRDLLTVRSTEGVNPCRVNTVLGPIPSEELGLVAVHEHIGYGMPGSELDTQWWKTPSSATRRPSRSCGRFPEYSRAYGGGTFVDATGICNGRDVDYYKSLSAKTGVHIVACTGFVGGDTALPFFARASVDYLTRQFVHEITVGIGDTGSRAGVIKVGVSRGGRMTDLDKRIYRAAARAALTTGVPILTHLAIDAENAIAIFHEEGLPLDRVLFGHVDDGVNARQDARHAGSPSRGARVGFDTFGYETELRTRRSGPAPARSGWTTSSASSGRARSTRCSPRPTPTAARSAGRASRATPSTTSSRT